MSDIKSGINLAQILGDMASGFCVPCVIRRREIPYTYPLIRYSSFYKALQLMQGSGLLNHFLPSFSIRCYFLPIATFMLFISSKTSTSQRVLGLPIGLLDMGFHFLIFCTLLSSARLLTWPSQFNLCYLINPIIFCPFNMSLIS